MWTKQCKCQKVLNKTTAQPHWEQALSLIKGPTCELPSQFLIKTEDAKAVTADRERAGLVFLKEVCITTSHGCTPQVLLLQSSTEFVNELTLEVKFEPMINGSVKMNRGDRKLNKGGMLSRRVQSSKHQNNSPGKRLPTRCHWERTEWQKGNRPST